VELAALNKLLATEITKSKPMNFKASRRKKPKVSSRKAPSLTVPIPEMIGKSGLSVDSGMTGRSSKDPPGKSGRL